MVVPTAGQAARTSGGFAARMDCLVEIDKWLERGVGLVRVGVVVGARGSTTQPPAAISWRRAAIGVRSTTRPTARPCLSSAPVRVRAESLYTQIL